LYALPFTQPTATKHRINSNKTQNKHFMATYRTSCISQHPQL